MAWLKPLVKQLKNQSAVKVIRQLEALLDALPAGPATVTVARKWTTFMNIKTAWTIGRRNGRVTDGQRPGGGDLSAGAMPVQTPRSVLESGRGRSPVVPGNVLSQRPLATALSPHFTQPCKKLRCAPEKGWVSGNAAVSLSSDSASIAARLRLTRPPTQLTSLP